MTLHEQASRRLGRALTVGEHAVDLYADVSALEHGKQRLREAIEAEKARAIRQLTRHGRNITLRVTPAMVAVLKDLYAAGHAAAAREMDALGVEAPGPVELADAEVPDELTGYAATLQTWLSSIGNRAERDAVDQGVGVGLSLGGAADRAIERALIRRVPGALAAASELVSGPFLTGLAAGYEPALTLFGGWTYSAVMDLATCEVCRHYDGERFDTWDAIQAVLPNGGPNPACFGRGRCRCRPVPEAPASP